MENSVAGLQRAFDSSSASRACRNRDLLLPSDVLSTPRSGVKTNMGRSFFVVALAGLLLTGRAWSQECSQTIEANDQIQYNKKEIKVAKSCKEFTLTLKHVGMLAANVMGHNWVLSKTSDYQALAQAGQAAGAPNYLPAGDAKRIAAPTRLRGGPQNPP